MSRPLAYLGLGMSIFFMAMSIMIIFRPPQFFDDYAESSRYLIAGLILIYGMFRFSRSIKLLRKDQFNK